MSAVATQNADHFGAHRFFLGAGLHEIHADFLLGIPASD
jgi:hypothetical protein